MLKVIIYIVTFFVIQAEDININFEYESLTSGTGYTFENSIITIKQPGTYILTGNSMNCLHISASPAKLKLENLIIYGHEEVHPFYIDKNCEGSVLISLPNAFVDSESNQNEGTIYMEPGSKLSFSFGDNPEDDDGDYIYNYSFFKMGNIWRRINNFNSKK